MQRPSDRSSVKGVAFVSTMAGSSWGGSEELWSRAAIELVQQGVSVSASVHGWSPPHERILHLAQAGVRVRSRPVEYALARRLWRKLAAAHKSSIVIEVGKFLVDQDPSLVVFSDGGILPPVELLEMCVSKRLKFVTVGQANLEGWWPDDQLADRYRNVMPLARRCFFVSSANQRLLEKQIGYELANAEVIRNPFNVDRNAAPPWPLKQPEVRLACVARLHPPSKGHDILLEAFSDPVWRPRNWRLTLYGEGPMRVGIERMVRALSLEDRVVVAGWVTPVEKIWAENHVLVLASRYEGLPLAMVEAMLCGRPVVATDIAGHSEIVQDGVTGFLAEGPAAPSMKKALERLWDRREQLEELGKAAAKSIREHVPADPARVFSAKIRDLANG